MLFLFLLRLFISIQIIYHNIRIHVTNLNAYI